MSKQSGELVATLRATAEACDGPASDGDAMPETAALLRQAAARIGYLERTRSEVADRLRAWGEAAHAAAMRSSDAFYAQGEQNKRDNYNALANKLSYVEAAPSPEGR